MLSALGVVMAAAPAMTVLPVTLEGMLCHPQRLVVKLEPMTSPLVVERAGVRLVQSLPQIGWAVVETAPSRLLAKRSELRSLPGVARVDLDRAARIAYNPNDALWVDMWHSRAIKADLAWDITKGSNRVVVAIMDTGVNTAHPDLGRNIWRRAGERAGNGIDDDGNGYIDDLYGYDFAYNDPVPNDVNGHGTACAGLAAAIQDNTIGVTGVAPLAKIMCLKAANDAGYFYDSANAPAYLYAADNGAKVISGSFFSDRVSQIERDALDYAWNQGCLPVIAAGNSNFNTPYYPAGYEDVIAVAATDGSNAKAGFSNYGTWVDVAAPGVSLRTTTASGGYTSGFAGTSGATPIVAGLAALLFGYKPTATNAQVRAAIEDTAVAQGWDFSNYGLIDAQAAVNAMNVAAPAKPALVRYATPVVRSTPGVMRIYGRGLQAPRTVRVLQGTTVLPILRQTRDYVDVTAPAGNSMLRVEVNNVEIRRFVRPLAGFNTYPLIEFCSRNGGVVTGDYWSTLNVDNVFATFTAVNGVIRVDGAFRKVTPKGADMRLRYSRAYQKSTTGTERLFLYDWSSASFPYGSYVNIWGGAIPTSKTEVLVNVPNVARFIDPEGTMYFRIETDSLAAAAKLVVDMAHLRD